MMALMSARGWRSIDTGGFFLITGGRLVGTIAGLVLLVLASKRWLSALTGFLIVAVALGSFLKPSLEVNDRTGLPATWPRGWWAPSRPSAGHRFALVYPDRSGAELLSTLAILFVVGILTSLAGRAAARVREYRGLDGGGVG
jgi:uncharacterized membrane protein YfcA